MANAIYADMPTTIFEVMSGLAREHGAINLGQGFPDDPGPEAVRRKAADAVLNGYNQYPPMAGLPDLRQAVARHYGRVQGLELDWASEVTITSGATEALADAFLALLEPGDEAIVFTPIYDSYLPMIRRAGATGRVVRLSPPDWRIDFAAVEAAIGPRTRLIVLNDPLNPSGSRAHPDDLAALARLCVEHDLIAVCDEVWEQIVFDGAQPSLADDLSRHARAHGEDRLGGQDVRPDRLEGGLRLRGAGADQGHRQGPPVQHLHHRRPTCRPPSPLGWTRRTTGSRPCRAACSARATGWRRRCEPTGSRWLTSAGTYFLLVDLAKSGIAEDDHAFCLRAVKEAGVAAIPISAFYEADPPTASDPALLRQVRRDAGRSGAAARQGAGAFASGGDGELTLARRGAFLGEGWGRA